MIDKEIYKNANSKLQLSIKNKELLIKQACSATNNNLNISNKMLYIKVLAASVAIIFIGGIACFNLNKQEYINNPEYNFSVIVQAADSDTKTEINSGGIKMNCGEFGNLILQERINDEFIPYKDKNGKENLLINFVLTNFEISGENIDTVTFSFNGNNQYFSIDNNNKNFTATKGLTHSNYTENELKTYLDGNNENIFCDEFMYKKPDDKNNINHIDFSSRISIISETNRDNKKIDELTDLYFDYSEKINKEKIKLYYETNGVGGGTTPPLLEEYYIKLNEIQDQILALELKDVTMTITVKTTDNKETSKTIKLGYDKTEAYGQHYNWITMQLIE